MRYSTLGLLLALTIVRCQAQDEKAAAIGAQLAKQVTQSSHALGVGDVSAYVNGLGQRLAAHKAPLVWKFDVIKGHQDGSTHKPIALPGGL